MHVFDRESLTHCETFQKNVKEMMDANGVRVLVDLLTLAHLHTTRATVPLQVGGGSGDTWTVFLFVYIWEEMAETHLSSGTWNESVSCYSVSPLM